MGNGAIAEEGADEQSESSKPEIDWASECQLDSLDRYERRALSRRKSAARAFDGAFMEALRNHGFPATICDGGAGSK